MDLSAKIHPLYPYLSEEIVAVRDYDSAEALKADIRRIVDARQAGKWHLYEMISQGPFLSLLFKQKLPS
jgi:hypothetical protein